MINFTVKKELFNFNYLHDYAKYLLENRFDEFVTVGIRFSREADLPLLKLLSKFSEKELVDLSLESNRLLLEALAKNRIADHIEESSRKWISNTLQVIDKDDVAAEDLTLVFYLRRKLFAYFLDAYTKNVVLQKFIIAELDVYTTQEELISYNIYLKMQQEKLAQMNRELAFQQELLLEAQEMGGMGSFSINFKDQSKSVFTPEYKKIFEMENITSFDQFLEWVVPEDRQSLAEGIASAYKHGGSYEVEYRYRKTKEKRIWAKGYIVSENERPVFIRGVARDTTDSAPMAEKSVAVAES
ncbi:MAG: hypothetical protein JWO09_280 [Bacteroidetes bacterium]|nr:hypothetical protein [Bacteroidota bacterium]